MPVHVEDPHPRKPIWTLEREVLEMTIDARDRFLPLLVAHCGVVS